MIDGAEAHALKAALLDPIPQVVHDLRILRFEQAMRHEPARVAVQGIVDIRIVPTVNARIDEHGVAQSKIAHLRHLIFDGRIDGGLGARILRMAERKFRMMRPDFEMGVDDQPAWLSRQACRCLREKLPARGHIIAVSCARRIPPAQSC